MPRTELTLSDNSIVLDARPDRIDHRDRQYQPPLVSLPPSWPRQRDIELALPHFRRMVGDQEKEGACTGFGLASVINYVLWRDTVLALPRSDRGLLAINLDEVQVPTVSPYQLYHLARIYDEWDGEDYEGSSCRGAVKGFHKHGVCLQKYWPSKQAPAGDDRMRWQSDAASRPLGAYYRIDRLSINDLQAAIYEIGAVYASARVHKGWLVEKSQPTLPVIKRGPSTETVGAHAFAVIGYEPRGFIIQNSWGKEWGYHGFALLPYDDWADNALDAWVAVLGAPTAVMNATDSDVDGNAETMGPSTLHSFRMDSLTVAATRQPGWYWQRGTSPHSETHPDAPLPPLSREEAYALTLVLENDGRVLRRRVGFDSAADTVDELAIDLPMQWYENHREQTDGNLQLMVYFHGGLNSESDSLDRIQILAPYFLANNIYPLFVTWKTSFLDSIKGILDDSLHRFFSPANQTRSIGWANAIKEQVSEAKDRSIEVACQHLLVKPIWTQMKQNAQSAVLDSMGLSMLSHRLKTLSERVDAFEMHLIGHSAGSIPIGHWLRQLSKRELPVSSCRLFAPACTVGFANLTFGAALKDEFLPRDAFYLHVLSDQLERDDRVGPYGKSLLYLVSRALEINHKEPLLGLHWLHDPEQTPSDFWHVPQSQRNRNRTNPDVAHWQKRIASIIPESNIQIARDRFVSDGKDQIQQTHGSFDNQIHLMSDAIEQIRGDELIQHVNQLVY